jgi:hypothetical protein
MLVPLLNRIDRQRAPLPEIENKCGRIAAMHVISAFGSSRSKYDFGFPGDILELPIQVGNRRGIYALSLDATHRRALLAPATGVRSACG